MAGNTHKSIIKLCKCKRVRKLKCKDDKSKAKYRNLITKTQNFNANSREFTPLNQLYDIIVENDERSVRGLWERPSIIITDRIISWQSIDNAVLALDEEERERLMSCVDEEQPYANQQKFYALLKAKPDWITHYGQPLSMNTTLSQCIKINEKKKRAIPIVGNVTTISRIIGRHVNVCYRSRSKNLDRVIRERTDVLSKFIDRVLSLDRYIRDKITVQPTTTTSLKVIKGGKKIKKIKEKVPKRKRVKEIAKEKLVEKEIIEPVEKEIIKSVEKVTKKKRVKDTIKPKKKSSKKRVKGISKKSKKIVKPKKIINKENETDKEKEEEEGEEGEETDKEKDKEENKEEIPIIINKEKEQISFSNKRLREEPDLGKEDLVSKKKKVSHNFSDEEEEEEDGKKEEPILESIVFNDDGAEDNDDKGEEEEEEDEDKDKSLIVSSVLNKNVLEAYKLQRQKWLEIYDPV